MSTLAACKHMHTRQQAIAPGLLSSSARLGSPIGERALLPVMAQAEKRRASKAAPAAVQKPKKKQRAQEEQQAAAPPPPVAPAGPTGWEELDNPQDVQQQAGELDACADGAPLAGSPPPPPLARRARPPLSIPAALAPRAPAEPAQKEERPKLTKHAKKRAKEDRERQIREAEQRRLQARPSARGERAHRRAVPAAHQSAQCNACMHAPPPAPPAACSAAPPPLQSAGRLPQCCSLLLRLPRLGWLLLACFAQGDAAPTSAAEYEQLVLSSPNSSYLWIQYLASLIALGELDKARALADRALTTISYRCGGGRLSTGRLDCCCCRLRGALPERGAGGRPCPAGCRHVRCEHPAVQPARCHCQLLPPLTRRPPPPAPRPPACLQGGGRAVQCVGGLPEPGEQLWQRGRHAGPAGPRAHPHRRAAHVPGRRRRV